MSSQRPGGAASGRGGRTGDGPTPAALGAPPAGVRHTLAHGAAGHQQGVPGVQPTPVPVPSPPGCVPGAAGVPCAGLAALSVQSPTPAAAAAPGPCASPGGGVASRGGAPAAGLSGGVAGRPPAPPADSAAALSDGSPPELLDDDGVPLSAEAAASPFSPPATERHAAFLKLLDHKFKAALQKRHMRHADFSNLAAEAGAPLFEEESIIVAYLRVHQAQGLYNQAGGEMGRGSTGDADAAEALLRRAWVVLLAQALPVLQRRMDEGTLLPGTLRKVEEAYEVYVMQTIRRVKEEPVPSAASLQTGAQAFGYGAAIHAATSALSLLPQPFWQSGQRDNAQTFVLAVLHLIPKTAALRRCTPSEVHLVNFIERYLTPTDYGMDFYASVMAVWRSPAVADVLQARGSLQSSIAVVATASAEFSARQKADIVKRGLRRCALPSCGRQETTVLQFHVCGHCRRGVRYCCPEHAKQHWKAHKRETEAEEEAEGGQGGEAGSGGGAAA